MVVGNANDSLPLAIYSILCAIAQQFFIFKFLLIPSCLFFIGPYCLLPHSYYPRSFVALVANILISIVAGKLDRTPL